MRNVLSTFSTDTLLIRDLSRSRLGDDHHIPAVATLQLSLSVLFILFTIGWVNFLPADLKPVSASLEWYAVSPLPLAFFSVFTALPRARERMDLFLIASLAIALIQAVGVILVVHDNHDLPALVWLLIGIQVSGVLLTGLLCRLAI